MQLSIASPPPRCRIPILTEAGLELLVRSRLHHVMIHPRARFGKLRRRRWNFVVESHVKADRRSFIA